MRINALYELNDQLNNAISTGLFSTAMVTGGGLGPVISANAIVLNDKSPEEDSNDMTGRIIGIVVGAVFLICLSIVGSIIYMKRNSKVGQLQ